VIADKGYSYPRCRRLGEGERARSAAERALRLDAELPDAWRAQAEALHALGRVDEAVEAERRANELETAQRQASAMRDARCMKRLYAPVRWLPISSSQAEVVGR